MGSPVHQKGGRAAGLAGAKVKRHTHTRQEKRHSVSARRSVGVSVALLVAYQQESRPRTAVSPPVERRGWATTLARSRNMRS